MKYSEAINLKNSSLNLIGTSDEQGYTIGDIIILPINDEEQNLFFQRYLISFDAESALLPFIDSDLQVWTIDTNYLRKTNMIIYNRIG